MLKVGLTGGMGSGKSTVAEAFRALGVPVFNADEETKRHLSDPEVVSKLRDVFGDSLFDEKGKPDRKKLAAIVFSDKAKLAELNAIMHPIAAAAFISWVSLQRNAPYVIKEAAILFESGADKQVDRVVTISCPEALRIQRVMKRDGITEAQVRARLNNQLTDAQREERSQHVIRDDGGPVLDKVLKLHTELLSLSNK